MVTSTDEAAILQLTNNNARSHGYNIDWGLIPDFKYFDSCLQGRMYNFHPTLLHYAAQVGGAWCKGTAGDRLEFLQGYSIQEKRLRRIVPRRSEQRPLL